MIDKLVVKSYTNITDNISDISRRGYG